LIDSIFSGDVSATLVPPGFLNCVVALGYNGPGIQNGSPVPHMWHTTGTGFFYGHLFRDDVDPAKKLYSAFLVTAKHVVMGYAKMQAANPSIGGLKMRINPIDAASSGAEFDLIGEVADPGAMWTDNPKGMDVSVIPVNLNALRDRKYEFAFFASDQMVAGIDKLRDIGTSSGDGVFVLGFPLDLAGLQKNYVIVRGGIIARVSEMLDRASETFLIDSFVFPGNSGGPVILKPEIVSINGTKTNAAAYLIGLVSESVEYVDTAISPQTGRPRITFEENTGLAKVLPVDCIDDAIMVSEARKP
jgi:hypothetical protein